MLICAIGRRYDHRLLFSTCYRYIPGDYDLSLFAAEKIECFSFQIPYPLKIIVPALFITDFCTRSYGQPAAGLESLARQQGPWADIARLWLGRTSETAIAKRCAALPMQDRQLRRGLVRFYQARAAELRGDAAAARKAYRTAFGDLTGLVGAPERVLARARLDALGEGKR